MPLYADTSALYALLSADDLGHSRVVSEWREIRATRRKLTTSSYVLLETIALLTSRLGLEAVRAFDVDFVPVLDVHWVDAALHDRAMSALLTAGQRKLSLVDCVGFEIMREQGLKTAFALDNHFALQGFRCIPD